MTEEQERLRLRQAQHIAELHARQADEVARKLRDLQLHQQSEERRLKEVWDTRAKQQWQRIEGVIKQEEDKLKAKLEAERKVREEEEKRQREAELKRRLLEEKKRQEEEAKKREEEETRRKQEEERKQREEEEQRLQKEQQEKDERTKAERDQRQALGVSTALEDWRQARQALHVSCAQHPTIASIHSFERLATENGGYTTSKGRQGSEVCVECFTSANYTKDWAVNQ